MAVYPQYAQYVQQAADTYGVDQKLIWAVIEQESGGDAKAVSSAGAQGLMQLMPATAKGLGVKDSFDPQQNILGGTKYLSQMLQKYDGDTEAALAAYNQGPGRVDKYGKTVGEKYYTSVLSKMDGATVENLSTGITQNGFFNDDSTLFQKVVTVIVILMVVFLAIVFVYFAIKGV